MLFIVEWHPMNDTVMNNYLNTAFKDKHSLEISFSPEVFPWVVCELLLKTESGFSCEAYYIAIRMAATGDYWSKPADKVTI